MQVLAGPLAAIALLAVMPSPAPSGAPFLDWEVVSRRPHDMAAYTQGLELDAEGRLFESTGLTGQSSIREVDGETGQVVRSLDLPEDLFGEGLTLVGDRLIQLTWKAGLAFGRDTETLEAVDTLAYAGEGWGLCFDGERLVMSDGSSELQLRDPASFEIIGTVAVTLDGAPVTRLNELECVDGEIWANVWYSDAIVRIDPADGRVTGILDLTGILEPHPGEAQAGSVLNGIAHDPVAGTFLVTGKHWPELIEIRVLGPDE